MNNENPNVIVDLFSYVFPTFAVAPAANQQQQVLIQADSDFECLQLMFHADIAAAAFLWNTRPLPNVTLLLTDSGSGRQLMNAAVPLSALAGIAEQPAWLPQTKIFQRNATVVALITNFDVAVTYNIRLTMVGRKIFQLGGQ